jgi:microcystin-dependent protein
LCDGSIYSKTLYSELFSIIGITYGGDGVTTFAVPNLCGRTIIGTGTGPDLTTRLIGASGGEETHTLTSNEMPSHTHSGTTASNGDHTHNYNDAYYAEAGGNEINGNDVFGTHGSNDTDNQFRWRTANGSWSTSPADLATSTAGSHTHTFTSNSTGSGGSHNNMQPYLVLSYIIKY